MTDEERDSLLDEATHGVREAFEEAGIPLKTEHLHEINDFLTEFLARIEPVYGTATIISVMELQPGDEWIENRRRVRFTGSSPHPLYDTMITIGVVDVADRKPKKINFFRMNSVEVIARASEKPA